MSLKREFLVPWEKDLSPEVINLNNLTQGRVDSICRIISGSFFLSHSFRKEVILYLAFPSFILKIEGGKCRGVGVDERSIGGVIKKFLKEKKFPGFSLISLKEISLSEFLVLEEEGEEIKFSSQTNKFIIGSFKGFPGWFLPHIKDNPRVKIEERSYLTSQCITILNYELDRLKERT